MPTCSDLPASALQNRPRKAVPQNKKAATLTSSRLIPLGLFVLQTTLSYHRADTCQAHAIAHMIARGQAPSLASQFEFGREFATPIGSPLGMGS